MARRVFFSFHYKLDNWRASQIRNIGVIEGNRPVSDNDWEQITRGGDKAIRDWIAEQMKGKSCIVVLIGANTAGRKWIKHEIKKAWNDGKGVLGIYIHNLKDEKGNRSSKGRNPFGEKLSKIVKAYDPPYSRSKYVYDHIRKNLIDWVEEAIEIRNKFKGKCCSYAHG